ncbi:MAG: glycosyltransferase [Planctomycetes bacterium]|nr:glycosyltransferase [Planctomycetota bacterium]
MTRGVLGVLVPCRDEAAVVERKLANLARLDWPASPAVQRVVVIDDGSRDGTAELARRAAARLFAERSDVEVRVVANTLSPGKAGAIASGLAELGSDVELVVLTDADVICERGALVALAAAFEREPRLALACGAQRFVRELAADGAAPDARAAVDDGGTYDRWTALVRALESKSGRLLSVHGQLLAWRRALELRPTPGLAADDIDLRMQALRPGARIELVPSARFLEVKAPAGEARRAQELRRARAYVQCVGDPRVVERATRAGLVDRLHFACYRRLPLAAPWLVAFGLVLAPLAAYSFGGPRVAAAVAVLLLAFLASPVGRRLAKLLAVIVRASRAERRESLSDAWRTARR